MKKTPAKYITMIILGYVGFFAGVSANDCDYIQKKTYTGVLLEFFPDIVFSNTSFLSEQNRKVAVDHLKDSCGFNTPSKKQSFPRSQYLVDHVMDVMMRSLDGEEKLKYETMQLDEKAKEYREEIRKTAESSNSVTPLEVELVYKKYREPIILVVNINAIETISLSSKYSLLCQIISTILTKRNQTLSFEAFKISSSPNQIIERCNTMIQQRMQAENTYVNLLMIEKGNKFLQDNLNSYTYKYFANTRLPELLESFLTMQTTFGSINSKVVEGTNQCKK